MAIARQLFSLVVASSAVCFIGTATATALQGGVISVLSGGGDCHDVQQVPLDTPQDSFTLSGSTACSGGSAAVDLRGDSATGSVGLRASASRPVAGSSNAAAEVALSDRWLITPAPGTFAGMITIPVTLGLEGTVSANAVADSGQFLSYNLTIAGPYSPFIGPPLYGLVSAVGSVTTTGAFSQTFSGSLNFNYLGSGTLTAEIEMTLFLNGLFEGSVDFYNTAWISMQLPEGYSATTSSGLPLRFSQAVTPVPEPETWALLATGLLLLRWKRGGTRTAQAA